jgi:hypothetical protein
MSELTKVISARVPIDVANMFDAIAKEKGVTKSSILVDALTQAPNTSVNASMLAKGGKLATTPFPDELKGLLSIGGGLGTGLIVYNVLEAYLPNDGRWTDEKRNAISTLGATAAGLFGFLTIDSLVNKKS